MPTETNNRDIQHHLEKGVEFSKQFFTTILLHKLAVAFIKEHKPWQWLHCYGWTAHILVLAAVIILSS